MVRDKQDLCISVPSFFKCPISLDIMKSPVNLCTELTYNRFNIQRWLDDGNNTCPATMQLLPTKHFIPNCTLQNLIQICSDSLRRQTAFEPLISCDQVIPIVTNLKTNSDSLRFASLAKLLHFAKDSHQNKSFLAKIEGFVDQLVRFLDNVDGGVTAGTSVKFLERVVIVLGSPDSKIASARVLQFIVVDADTKISIAEKQGVVAELLKSASPEKDLALIEAALTSLMAISVPKRNKLKLVNLRAVKAMKRLMGVLEIVETALSTRKGRREICEDATECVAAVLSKVLKVSRGVTEHAVQEAVTQNNGLTKILLLMQSNCAPHVQQMCTDLLKIFRVNSKSCLSFYLSFFQPSCTVRLLNAKVINKNGTIFG
ncbi:U-box domain-containing protein 27 [Glycine soja]|uniref:U-box domain-containing protein n=1 Tax=Glycine soja TaxID=3848 RepID=A0A445IW90_GLYSO|nr:U-box domain-containing protein 27 [Glycine soja]